MARDNAYDEGDLITNPVYVIESILRDELGVITDNIDEVSFDATAELLVAYGFNGAIHEAINSADLIGQICNMFRLFLWFSTDGKFKIKYHQSSPTVQDTIVPSDLRADLEIIGTDQEALVNEGNFYYCFSRHWEAYIRNLYSINATSVTDYKRTVSMEFQGWAISDLTTITAMKNKFTGSSGYFKDLWQLVVLRTRGWAKMKLEIGDYVALSSLFDSELKCYGTSWAALKFVIVDKLESNDGLDFTIQRLT